MTRGASLPSHQPLLCIDCTAAPPSSSASFLLCLQFLRSFRLASHSSALMSVLGHVAVRRHIQSHSSAAAAFNLGDRLLPREFVTPATPASPIPCRRAPP